MDEEIKKINTKEKAKFIANSDSLESIPVKYLPDVFSDEYFFISYSHLDYKWVYIDLLALQDSKLNFWYDRGMSAGSDWETIARRNISPFACKGIIFYISENALKSEAVINELKYAKTFNKPIILVMLPFINGKYVDENGQSLKGQYFDISRMLELLKFNGVEIPDFLSKQKEIKELFPESVIYLRFDIDPSKKAEQLRNKIEEIPVLDTGLYEYNKTYYCYKITSVKLGENEVKPVDIAYKIVIDNSAFANCSFLETVEISDIFDEQRVFINDFAFFGCERLTKITMPETLTLKARLFSGAFCGCSNLEEFHQYRDKSGQLYKNICELNGKDIFKGCFNLKEVWLSDTTKIDDGVFHSCEKLEKIGLFDEIYYIGRDSFAFCESLKELILTKVKVIEEGAFYNCSSLEQFYIPNCIEYVGKDAFYGTKISDYHTKDGVIYLGSEDGIPYLVAVGVENKEQKTYKLHKDCRVIAGGAFEGLEQLETINLPLGLISIGNEAFKDCHNLKKIALPKSAKRIGESAFENCTSLSKLSFFDTMDSIDDYAFYNCTSLKKYRYYSRESVMFSQINLGTRGNDVISKKGEKSFLAEMPYYGIFLCLALATFYLLFGFYVLITTKFFPDFVEQEIAFFLNLSKFANEDYLRETYTNYSMFFAGGVGFSVPSILFLFFQRRK